jgi:hypothetical protein
VPERARHARDEGGVDSAKRQHSGYAAHYAIPNAKRTPIDPSHFNAPQMQFELGRDLYRQLGRDGRFQACGLEERRRRGAKPALTAHE